MHVSHNSHMQIAKINLKEQQSNNQQEMHSLIAMYEVMNLANKCGTRQANLEFNDPPGPILNVEELFGLMDGHYFHMFGRCLVGQK